MVRKLSLICAIAAALLFPIPTFAVEGQGSDQGKGPSHGQGYAHDHEYRHDHRHGDGHGHARHWYHGQWWDYGVGPCWQRTPIGWIWICGD
jgi:hypothetical protein